MGKFKTKAITKMDDLKVGDEFEESDFSTLTPSGNFVQLEYVEEEKVIENDVSPGTYVIGYEGMRLKLHKTSFVKDTILESFLHTENISSRLDIFFKKLHIYKKYGIEVPKRSMLLYGPGGTGKTCSIIKAIEKYEASKDTIIIVWPTDKIEPYDVKEFIKSFNYEKNGVKQMILLVEDIGGVEIDKVTMKSTASLLSLLDNQEKTFKIPIYIIATTNFPEIFLGNLTNRPGRFSDKIEVGFPPPEFREALFKFFAKERADDESVAIIKSDKCKKFTADHIKEIVIRSDIYDKTIQDCIKELLNEIEYYENAFQKRKSMGFGE